MADSEYDRLRAVSPEDARLLCELRPPINPGPESEALSRRLRELLEDKDRLDWLEQNATSFSSGAIQFPAGGAWVDVEGIREAIDLAMRRAIL